MSVGKHVRKKLKQFSESLETYIKDFQYALLLFGYYLSLTLIPPPLHYLSSLSLVKTQFVNPIKQLCVERKKHE